ncbi:MAG: FHA domain-containing protein [Muribaculaceae bacterium]|nr:FHA domain-containing protein [Muribaculaceae bacterium]
MKEFIEKLKGKEIFVGRESGTDRLLVYLSINGQIKVVHIGNPGSVPKSVSRAIPNQNKAHISIKIDDNGNINVSNLKPENVTFVNGSPIVSKRISEDDKVELGADHYQLPLNILLQSAQKLGQPLEPNPTPKPEVKTFNITHLEKVWNDFHEGDLAIKDKQHKMGLQQRIPIFFTIGAGALTSVAWSLGWGEWIRIVSICLTGIGLLLMIYFFIQSSKFNPVRETDKLREDFQNRYVCPNPECHRFLGNYSYTMMKNQFKMECPYCKSKFKE